MSNTRRYSITKEESEIILLALGGLINELKQIEIPKSTYFNIQIERAKILREKLSLYQWYK